MKTKSEESTFKKVIRKLDTIRYIIVGILAIWLVVYVIPTSTNGNNLIDTVKSIQYNNLEMETITSNILNELDTSTEPIEWFVEGENSQGKIVIAEKGTTRVIIETVKDGDYITIYPENVIITNKVLTMTLSEWY